MIISPHTERTFDKVQWLIHDYKKTKRKQQKNAILGKVELGDQAPVFPHHLFLSAWLSIGLATTRDILL